MKGINLQISEFRRSLMQVVNDSGMPVEITKMVLRELHDNASKASARAVYEEGIEYKEEEASKEKGESVDGKENT